MSENAPAPEGTLAQTSDARADRESSATTKTVLVPTTARRRIACYAVAVAAVAVVLGASAAVTVAVIA